MTGELAALESLARRAGVSRHYRSWRGEPVEAPVESLVAILRALGAELTGPGDAAAADAAWERAWWQAGAPPVVVAWDGAAPVLGLRVPADVDGDWEVEVVLESGRRERAGGRLFHLPASDHAYPGGAVWCVRSATLPGAGELGYHTVAWRVNGRSGEATVIAAPSSGFGRPDEVPRRWGVFAPTYALRGERAGGAGDLGELGRLAELVGARGGHYVATLPILAQFLDEPFQPSPYGPASRLAWNELYLDLAAAPGLDQAPVAQNLLASPTIAVERAALAALPLVDYRRQYAWRRQVIDAISRAAWGTPALRAELERFAAQGDIADYAVFRAVGEATRTVWPRWSEPWREAAPVELAAVTAIRGDGYDPAAACAHVYAQWAMTRQLAALRAGPVGVYLDLPVGVSRDAYDVWRHRASFVLDASTGAPPDGLFLGGQDWGLPPLHPERARAGGWRYLRRVIAHHMSAATMLRIDHVMGLHRLYWVPAGASARHGVYVRYPADELYAIFCLESQRHRCAIAGEDLGTVPDEVRPALKRHGIAGLYVGQFAMPGRAGERMADPGAEQVASLDTHDTPTFAGFWHGDDIDDRVDLGLITADQAVDERRWRGEVRTALLAAAGQPATDDPGDQACATAMAACTRQLAASPAYVVLVTAEDLWLERRPQNVPGTSDERPNWRRPWARTLDDLAADPSPLALLDDVARLRREG